MKKKILIVQGSLKAGGAEKATVSLLNALPSDRYEVDLMLPSREGLFFTQLPDWVNVIDCPFPFNCFSHKPKELDFYKKHPIFLLKKIWRTFKAKRQKNIHLIQHLWLKWEKDIPIFDKEYDIAYGGQEGLNNYYVVDKVKAARKILWIHNDYEKLKYQDDFDRPYFKKATIIATMSQNAKAILEKHFPEIADRIWFLENISCGHLIKSLSLKPLEDDAFKLYDNAINILSVGRLAPQKNYSRALHAAHLLKMQGVAFHWTIIGDGPQHKMLAELLSELKIEEDVSIIGLRANPYQYMSKVNMLVVSSDFEGRSIVIDEAQILGIPVITTNYPTAKDAVVNEETGLICEMTPEAMATSILRLHSDKRLYAHICKCLESKKEGNVKELEKYYKAFGD